MGSLATVDYDFPHTYVVFRIVTRYRLNQPDGEFCEN